MLFFSWTEYKLLCGLRVGSLETSADNNHMAPNLTVINHYDRVNIVKYCYKLVGWKLQKMSS